MVLQDDYIEALNNCIERLSLGETIEAILRDYPTMANELRPMLEAGNLFSRVAYPMAEITASQTRLEPAIRQAAQTSFGASPFSFWPIVIVLLVTGLIGFAWQANAGKAEATETISPTNEVILEATAELIEATLEVTAELSPEASQNPALITIEGDVTAINANVITIYDMEIVLEPSDPLLTIIQLGDNLRVEGEYQSGTTIILIAVTIVFVDVDVFVNEGEVWRDSGNCNNPPPPWATANGWRRRCEGGGGGSNGGGNNGRSGRGRGGSGGS
jgi:uncharacterized membrane protein YgcG